jgi:beta-lactamase regulating signal transducer with metallopeptidase domain
MNNFLLYMVESGICLGLFYLVYLVFLRRETFFAINRFYLMLSIPLSFLIPLINLPSPFRTAPPTQQQNLFAPVSSAQTNSFGLVDILWVIYLAGVGLFLARFAYKITQLILLIRKNEHQKYGRIHLVYIDEDSAPFSFFNFFFLNKSKISQHDLLRIIDHELVHINQHHTVDLIIIELLTIVEWFNPFVRPYKTSLKETHEYLADNHVIQQGCSRAKYQLLIFEQHVGVKLFEFVNNFNHSLIKRRITMMTKGKSKTWAKSKFFLMIPVICFLVLAFANPKPATPKAQAKLTTEYVLPTLDEPNGPAATEDQKASEDEKKKEKEHKLQEIQLKEQKLKKEYEKTDDPKKKELIKKKLIEIQKMKEKEGWIEHNPGTITEEQYIETTKKIKAKLANTDDPEETKKLKAKLANLQEMKKKGLVKSSIAINYEKEAAKLKEMYEKTDDPEKKKLIKEKLMQLKELAAKEREKKKGKSIPD